MKNTFGNSITVTLFGESHGTHIGAVVDGITPGLKVDTDIVAEALRLRRPSGDISTKRVESDRFSIISGVKDGYTTGAPLCIVIENLDTKSADYDSLSSLARPSHVDFSAYLKYHGYEDKKGSGHFSGRLSAPIVAVGAILREALKEKGILIGTHVLSIKGIKERGFDQNNIKKDVEALSTLVFPTLEEEKGEMMKKEILKAREEGDSVGGVLETAIVGMPGGVGEPWFDSIESTISHAMFSIGGVKAIEFGLGFDMCNLYGSEANDILGIKDGEVALLRNNSGGINGGISNGAPIIFRLGVKPTPTIFKEQKSVDYINKKDVDLRVCGRHDPCIVHRVRAVVDAMTAIAVADMLVCRFGTDYLK
jgi:chorismate synthase